MDNNNAGDYSALLGVVIIILALCACLYGYIANIVKLVGMLGGDITAMFIARGVSIFFVPLGIILGYV